MGLSTPADALRMAPAGALLLLVLLSPASVGQIPDAIASSALSIVILCPDSLLEPNWAGQDEITCILQDLSRDSVVVPGSSSGTGLAHTVSFSMRPGNSSLEARGWQTELTVGVVPLYGGESIPFTVRAKATPVITTQQYDFEVVAEYTGPGDHKETLVVPFVAEVNPYDIALVSWSGPQVQKAGQDEILVYSVLVTNSGVFPDRYRFSVKTDPDVKITTPGDLYVAPGESRTANFTVLTPKNKLYETGRSVPISVKVNSLGVACVGEANCGSGVYSTVGVLQIRGPHFPLYWIPLLIVGLTSGAVVVRGSRQKAEFRRLEKGRPRRVDLTPRQEALLVELRRSDPETYKEKRAALDRVYKERLDDYRSHRRERLAADRAEAKEAHLEFIAKKKARKAERRAEKKALKLRRAEEARAAKLAKKEARKEAKLVKKKEKIVAKARAKLEKARAKAEARDAKLAAKQAKLDAKQAKAEAKAAKQAEKERKKAEKGK